ncbi:MFS transporter [Paenibacillus thailandensis]|uniref:MFS transporter n=2 Tax=Paenibacillus thailandensis TaxID=393250 RepID=A0ABW5QT70_9BACL
MQVNILRFFNFGYFSMFSIFLSFLPLYLADEGISRTQIGALLGVGGVVSVFAQPMWGLVSDYKKTIKKVLLVIIGVSVVSGFCLFNASAPAAIVLLVIMMYVFCMPTDPLIESLNYQSAQRRGIPYGSIKMFGALGYATASLLIGYITDNAGMASIAFLFLGYGFVTFVTGFALQDVQAVNKPLRMKDLGGFLSERSTLVFLALVLLMAIPHRTNDTYIGLYIAELGGGMKLVGYAWFIMTISEVVCFAFVHRLLKPGRELGIIAVAGIIYAIRFGLTAIAGYPVVAVLLQALQGVTFVLFYTASVQYLYTIIPEQFKATGQTVLAVVFFGISGIFSSFAGGYLLETLGGANLYGIMACLSLIGAVVCLFIRREARQAGETSFK